MMRFLFVFFVLFVVSLRAGQPVAEILTVQGSTIYPTNVAAEVSAVAQAVAQAEAAAAQAAAVETAAAMVSAAVAGVTEVVNSLEGIGYVRGYVLQFGAGIEADTNLTASIIRFDPVGTDGTNALFDIYTYFTQDPGTLPVIRYSDSLGRSNEWSQATAVGTPELTEVTVGGTLYEAYRNRVAMPPAYAAAYFRTFADVTGAGTNQVYMPINNGVAVNGVTPLTATMQDGTNVYRWIGGIRVQ